MENKVMFNLNDQVKVKLNEHGISIYEKYYGKGTSPYYSGITLDSEGYYSTQWWVLMEMFGSSIGMHLPSPFETLFVIMDESSITPKPATNGE